MTKPKKVLIVCYYWPPAGGPGVQRWLKFVKYLPGFGIKPIVYVPENPSYPIIDQGLLEEVPKEVAVLKQPIKEPYRYASLFSSKQTKSLSSGLVPSQKKQSLVQKLLLYIRGNYFVPDARVGWVKPSIAFLKTYIEREGIQTLITTGPPHSMHLIGLGLKQCFPELQWIADFRDPWTTIGYHDKLKMTFKTQKRHIALEQEVLNQASEVIVTSLTTQKQMQSLSSTPITVITNGYDVQENTKLKLNKIFTISHIGSLLSDRNPIVLWEVISELIETNDAFKNNFKLVLSGRVSEAVLEHVFELGLRPYVELKGYVSHKEAIEQQRSSNLLLLIEIDAKKTQGIIPGKLFEYLAARRPILAIGPKDSDIQGVIEQTQSGAYFTYDQSAQIKKMILEHFEMYANKQEVLQKGDIQSFHRKTLTETLSNSILQ